MRLWFLAISITLTANAQGGKQQFEARCIGCHGQDGTGGAHGPSIVETSRTYRAPTREAIRNLILNGTPDAGMPPFRISVSQSDSIAAYVMTLRQPASDGETGARDAAPRERSCGERNCALCHLVRGRGGIADPDFAARLGGSSGAALLAESQFKK